jgi:hypothetical protein
VAAEGLKVGDINLTFSETIREAQKEKRTYQDKLEEADPAQVFKYVFLINNASVELYVQQSRQQATASFDLSRRVAIVGFALLSIGVVVGIISGFVGEPLAPAYLAGIAGTLTEFIAGVFFYLYNRTLQQINLFYQGMMSQQQDALAAIGATVEGRRQVADWKAETLAQAVKATSESEQEQRTP